MTLDFTCQACDATFEADLSDLLEDPALECPTCDARAPRAAIEGMTGALDDLFTQLALLNRKFTVTMEVESEDLPAGYEPGGRRSAASDEGEEDEEDDEEATEEGDEEWAEDRGEGEDER